MNTGQAAPVLEAELSPQYRPQGRCCDLAVPPLGAQTPPGHLWDEGMSPATGRGLAQQRGIKQRRQAWACPSKEPFEANKEGIHVLFLAGRCGLGEAEHRPVKSVGWRAAGGGCPAAPHSTALTAGGPRPGRPPAPRPGTAGPLPARLCQTGRRNCSGIKDRKLDPHRQAR